MAAFSELDDGVGYSGDLGGKQNIAGLKEQKLTCFWSVPPQQYINRSERLLRETDVQKQREGIL